MKRFFHLFRRRQFDRELAAEMQEHLDEKIETLIESGMDPQLARRCALREFGNTTASLEESREIWTFPWLESYYKDARYGFRTLVKRPGFSTIVCVTLALGIGANAAIFGLIDGLWFRPLGVHQPDRIVRIFSVTAEDQEGDFSYPEYRAISEQADVFESIVACGRRGVRITNKDGTHELLLVNVVSENFFEAVGVRPVAGRLFETDDQPTVVLGYSFWRRYFGGNPDAIGKQLRVERGNREVLVTISGVLPSSFREIETGADRDLWMPIQTGRQIYARDNFNLREYRWFTLIGRLAWPLSELGAKSGSDHRKPPRSDMACEQQGPECDCDAGSGLSTQTRGRQRRCPDIGRFPGSPALLRECCEPAPGAKSFPPHGTCCPSRLGRGPLSLGTSTHDGKFSVGARRFGARSCLGRQPHQALALAVCTSVWNHTDPQFRIR